MGKVSISKKNNERRLILQPRKIKEGHGQGRR